MGVGEKPMSNTFLKPKKALSFYVIPKQQNRGIYIPFCRMLIVDFSNHLNFIGSINAKMYQALEAKTWGGRDYEQTEKAVAAPWILFRGFIKKIKWKKKLIKR